MHPFLHPMDNNIQPWSVYVANNKRVSCRMFEILANLIKLSFRIVITIINNYIAHKWKEGLTKATERTRARYDHHHQGTQ